MDSEQIKKDLTNEPFFNINGPLHQESNNSPEPVADHRKLKGQVIAQPSDNGVLQPTEYPVDPWDNESASIEQQLLSDIRALAAASINDKIELKKHLSDLYKQTHELMTRYNQRIQNLLMDDRFYYRHSSEISALMIRGLMPPLEEIKTLEKSLTSTRKKTAEESIDQLQKSAGTELEKVEKVLKDAKSRITKYTQPLKPAQLLQIQLDQRLAQEAAELQLQVNQSEIQKSVPAENVNSNIVTSNSIPVKAATPQETSTTSAEKERSTEDLTSKPLKTLVKELENSSPEARKRTNKAILHYVESEYQHYAPLRPFLSVAGKKCDLLSMNPDKACKACQDDISLLEDTVNEAFNNKSNNNLPLDALMQIDKAINKLAAFDKKLPGEVWQLLTELTPHGADSRYHLLNLLCRKLLLDGPTPLTQKAVLNKFKDVEHYISSCFAGVTEAAEDPTFDQQFLAVYGHVFTSPNHLKKALNTVNKPHELNALLQIFQRINSHGEVLLSEAIDKLQAMGDEQQSECLRSGARAYEFLCSELPDRVSTAISSFSLSEPGSTNKQLTQSLLAKFSDYYKAADLATKLSGDIDKQSHNTFSQNKPPQNKPSQNKIATQLIKELSALLITGEQSENGQSDRLGSIAEDLQALINQPQPTSLAMLANCRGRIIEALQKKRLTKSLASTAIKQFLQIQNLMEHPEATPTSETRYQTPEELTEALATLASSASPKWYNQLFTSQLQEHRENTLAMVRTFLMACQQIIATPGQIASFIEAMILEIQRDNDDPLLKQLVSALEAYANQLK